MIPPNTKLRAILSERVCRRRSNVHLNLESSWSCLSSLEQGEPSLQCAVMKETITYTRDLPPLLSNFMGPCKLP